MYSIKQATTTDIPLIRELTMQVWPKTYTPILGSEQVAYMLHKFYDPASLAEQMEVHGHQFILCYDGDEPVGFAAFSAVDRDVYKLHKLYILREQQGKGIGHIMIGHIISAIRQLQASALELNVNIHNSPAISFYKKAGFVKYKKEDIDIGNGYFMNDFVFRLAL